MYPYNFNPNGFPIFTPPKIKTSTRLLTKQNLGAAKKFSLSSLIDTSNKAINAFNSFVPLYHEVKPMIENGKNVVDGVKKFLNKKKPEVKTVKKEKEVVDAEIISDDNYKTETKEQTATFENQTKPNSPFFN